MGKSAPKPLGSWGFSLELGLNAPLLTFAASIPQDVGHLGRGHFAHNHAATH